MNYSTWFQTQLHTSADSLLWSVSQVPPARRTIAPPPIFGTRSIARHIFHMVYYERERVLPHMLHWTDEALDLTQSFKQLNEDTTWQSEIHNLDDLLNEFQHLRSQQIALLPTFSDLDWLAVRPSGWGDQNMLWIVTKTFQHTTNHMNTILRMALFWT